MKKRTIKQILIEYKHEGVTREDIFDCHDCKRHYVWQCINEETGNNVVEENTCDACGGLFCEDCYDHTEYPGCMYFCKKCSVKNKNGEFDVDEDTERNMEIESQMGE
jgi:hypothetical protein